jgi:hypothetical protein
MGHERNLPVDVATELVQAPALSYVDVRVGQGIC